MQQSLDQAFPEMNIKIKDEPIDLDELEDAAVIPQSPCKIPKIKIKEEPDDEMDSTSHSDIKPRSDQKIPKLKKEESEEEAGTSHSTIKQEVKQEVKQEIKQEVKQEVKQEFKQEINDGLEPVFMDDYIITHSRDITISHYETCMCPDEPILDVLRVMGSPLVHRKTDHCHVCNQVFDIFHRKDQMLTVLVSVLLELSETPEKFKYKRRRNCGFRLFLADFDSPPKARNPTTWDFGSICLSQSCCARMRKDCNKMELKIAHCKYILKFLMLFLDFNFQPFVEIIDALDQDIVDCSNRKADLLMRDMDLAVEYGRIRYTFYKAIDKPVMEFIQTQFASMCAEYESEREASDDGFQTINKKNRTAGQRKRKRVQSRRGRSLK